MSKSQDKYGIKVVKQRKVDEPFVEFDTDDLYCPEDVADVQNGEPIAKTLARFDFKDATEDQMVTALKTSKEIKELNQLREDCGQLKESAEKLTQAVQAKDEKIENLQKEKLTLAGHLEDYKTSCESKETLLQTTKEEKERLAGQVKDLQEKLAKKAQAPVNNELAAENARLQAAVSKAAEDQEMASSALDRAKDLLKKKDSRIGSLQNQVDALEEQVEELKQQADPDDGNLKAFADLKMENLGLQTQLTESEGKAKELQVKLDKAEAEATELRTKLLGAQNEVDTLRQAQQEIPAPAADPDEELREKLERAKEWQDIYVIRAQNLESDLKNTQKALEEAKNARIRAEDNKANAERELKASEDEAIELRGQLRDANSRAEGLENSLEECKKEANRLRAELNTALTAAAAPKAQPEAIPAAPVAPAPVTAKAPKLTPMQMAEKLHSLKPTTGTRTRSDGSTTSVVQTFNGQPVNEALVPILQLYTDNAKIDWKPYTVEPDGSITIEK